MDQGRKSDQETPRTEPEIIPPGDPAFGARPRSPQAWSAAEDAGVHRVYVARVGPFSLFLLALACAAMAGVILMFVVGAFLIVLPLAGILLAAAVLSGMWRRSSWR
jgi:hypothetical protein